MCIGSGPARDPSVRGRSAALRGLRCVRTSQALLRHFRPEEVEPTFVEIFRGDAAGDKVGAGRQAAAAVRAARDVELVAVRLHHPVRWPDVLRKEPQARGVEALLRSAELLHLLACLRPLLKKEEGFFSTSGGGPDAAAPHDLGRLD